MTGDFRESVYALMVGGHYIWPQDEKFWRDLTTSSRDRWGTSLATWTGGIWQMTHAGRTQRLHGAVMQMIGQKWSEDLRHKKSNRVTKSCCDNLTLTEVIGCLESYPCTPNYFSYTTRESWSQRNCLTSLQIKYYAVNLLICYRFLYKASYFSRRQIVVISRVLSRLENSWILDNREISYS